MSHARFPKTDSITAHGWQTPEIEPIPAPADVPYPGRIVLHVDDRDINRRIFRVRQQIPVRHAGKLVLMYPEWLPGYHAPQSPIELLAGLTITAGGQDVRWKRHPVNVHAFFAEVPDGVASIEAGFQFLSPTDPAQGRVVVGPALLMLQWNTVTLYPAGYFARRIEVEASVTVPPDWQLACALALARQDQNTTHFAPAPLDVLIDSPVLAGRHFERISLDEEDRVTLNIAADGPELLDAAQDHVEPHRALVQEADLLFGTRHFGRYDVLLALSEELGSIGVEHHRSCEAVTIPGYFADWDDCFSRRDTIPHEYVHSWNGKYRRGSDSWTPSFEQPILNRLVWVYEGQTQYWIAYCLRGRDCGRQTRPSARSR